MDAEIEIHHWRAVGVKGGACVFAYISSSCLVLQKMVLNLISSLD